MNVKEAAAQQVISRRTAYKWLGVLKEGGEAALENWSSRPQRSSRQLAVERVATMAALRQMCINSSAIA